MRDGAIRPKDYKRWQDLVHALAEHLEQRYGRTKVATWYWEVWNEPDISYWKGTQKTTTAFMTTPWLACRSALPARARWWSGDIPGQRQPPAHYLQAFWNTVPKGPARQRGGAVPLILFLHAKGRPNLVEGHVQMGLGKNLPGCGRRDLPSPQFSRGSQSCPSVLSEAVSEGGRPVRRGRIRRMPTAMGRSMPAITAAQSRVTCGPQPGQPHQHAHLGFELKNTLL